MPADGRKSLQKSPSDDIDHDDEHDDNMNDYDEDDDDDDDESRGEPDWVISSVHPISVQLLHSSLARLPPNCQ